MAFAGIELGGTKCVCTLARSNEEVIAQETVPTSSPEETLSLVEEHLVHWSERLRIRGLGIASFGPIDLDSKSPAYGTISNTPKTEWIGANVGRRLQRLLAVPTLLDTDVSAAALAELRWGAGRGLDHLAYITVGTGVGVGLIYNGRPLRGFTHPELGHIRVVRIAGDEWNGSCPFHGDCVEGLASGSAINARLGEGRFDEFAPNHPAWETAVEALAQLCHAIVCSVAPQAIIIGGGVAAVRPQLAKHVGELLGRSLSGYLALPGRPAYVRLPALGVMAGPLGSIALAMDAAAAA